MLWQSKVIISSGGRFNIFRAMSREVSYDCNHVFQCSEVEVKMGNRRIMRMTRSEESLVCLSPTTCTKKTPTYIENSCFLILTSIFSSDLS